MATLTGPLADRVWRPAGRLYNFGLYELVMLVSEIVGLIVEFISSGKKPGGKRKKTKKATRNLLSKTSAL
jgi:hypothetical protein